MDFKHLFEMVRDLARKGFYGTLQIEFKNGKPYLGTKMERVLFDRPMVQQLRSTSLEETKQKEA
jgi:uncharacterized protein YueI